MRKTLIALILVLPMVFVLVVFSSVNLVSLGVNVSVNEIVIRSEEAKDGTLLLDMADGKRHVVTAEVSPANATEKGYTLTSSDPELVDVTKDGVIVPKKEGTAEIIAKSNDKSFTDTMSVVVVSSKPYDFRFSVLDGAGNNVLRETEEGYIGELETGEYGCAMTIEPMGFTEYAVAPAEGTYGFYEKGTNKLFLPYSGESEFSVTVPDAVGGSLKKTVRLQVTKQAETALVNGMADFTGMQLAYGTRTVKLYIQSDSTPKFSGESAEGTVTTLARSKYLLEIRLLSGAENGFDANVTATYRAADGKLKPQSFPMHFTFTDFDFSVFSDMPLEAAGENAYRTTLLTGNAASFYAVAPGGAEDVDFTWSFDGPAAYCSAEGATATVNAAEGGSYTLGVSAEVAGVTVEKTVSIDVVHKISVIQIRNNVKADLAENYTIAGMGYSDALELQEITYPLKVYTFDGGAKESLASDEDVEYSVDNEAVAVVETGSDGSSPVLVPKGTGKVTVTASWKGSAAFGREIKAKLTLNVIQNGVAVNNAPELVKAAEEGKCVVLYNNIKLGTDRSGADFSLEERIASLRSHRMKSTYNIEWYRNTKDAVTDDSSKISYVLEFKNDVYGNGKSIDADNFTHCLDLSSKNPKSKLDGLYDGPLYFVKYQQMASVAGQDNCAFLVRTDGVKLYGVNLLGCSDDSLLNEKGEYDLTNLNLTGTTLEINADCEVVNCRIRNGRNVVRAYGGNREGNAYFVESLTGSALSAADQIDVKIEGCILSQGREFLLKMGANRALRASKLRSADPALTDQNSEPYLEDGRSNRYGDLYKDAWFYSHYVMTDLTLKDSVLETSGFFTVGIESNFAGEFLFDGATDHQWRAFTREWERSGGTSFASVLRLEGDVRLYDWKDLSLIDSSTLIESPMGALSEWLKLDIKSMLEYVSQNNSEYSRVIEASDGKEYVHGGIALYGGGRDYSAVVMDGLNATLSDFLYINVNIDVLKGGDKTMQKQGDLLPKAAGTHDFNFYMYGKDSGNNYAKQRADEQRGMKYSGVAKFPLWA